MSRLVTSAAVVAAFTGAATAQVFTFSTEDDFVTPLVNGQDLSSPPEFGNLFTISSSGGLGAVIYDSDPLGPNAGMLDPDLLVDLGNIIVLQNSAFPTQTVPGIFDTVDDDFGGGNVTFSFVSAVELSSIDLVDIDRPGQSVTVLLSDSLGLTRTYSVETGWTNDLVTDGPAGYDTLDLTTLLDQVGEGGGVASAVEDAGFNASSVVELSVTFSGSGGLDNLAIIPAPASAVLFGLGGVMLTRRRR